ncbi:MAG: TRAP transporter small permease [Pseudomonadota bacterium]
MRAVRKSLDALYLAGGILGAFFLQMIARWTGTVLPGSTDYAGYCMAASSFFALAYALNHGAHIRVTLFLGRMGRWRRYGEIWCYAVAAVIATVFARYAIKANIWSEKLNDISQGQDATPLWIPQIAMSIGTVLLAIALWDHLLRLIFTSHMGVSAGKIEGET